jgi:MoxR-like ATPase
MTDVMSHGVYPHDPLPGRRERRYQEFFWVDPPASEEERIIRERLLRAFERPKPNPILEPPVYFPGATWKHTWVHA